MLQTYLVLGELEIDVVGELNRVSSAAVDDILGSNAAQHDVAMVTMVGLWPGY